MVKKQEVEEITTQIAAKRLHVDRRSIHRMIDRGALNAQLVIFAPRPFYLIAVDEKFLAEEKKRAQVAA